ncbi:PREDICTED: putative F-box protein At5g50220-like [Fragaria vesca subsp. vesca]
MSTSKLMELPHDILLNIFSKLPARSLLQFRCVSKSLCHLVDDPARDRFCSSDLAAMHIAATNEHIDVEVRFLPLSSYGLRFVSCGLLGFQSYVHGKFGLYNPLRGEYLWLPEPEDRYDIIRWEGYGMGFDSVTNTHKIVHFFSHGHPDSMGMVARVHVLGTSSWRRIPSVPPCSFNAVENAYAYGSMHWLERGNPRIISFDFVEEKFRWTNPPRLTIRRGSELFLISLRGSLALVDVVYTENVFYSEKKVEIWVHKEQKYWTKDYSMPLDYCSGALFSF